MYSLNCDYYQKEFNYLHELIDDVLMSGMDPNYEITKNGVGMKEMLNELIDMVSQIEQSLSNVKINLDNIKINEE
jgi:hypothetical protein